MKLQDGILSNQSETSRFENILLEVTKVKLEDLDLKQAKPASVLSLH